jgi:hypothetical protein
MRVSLTPQPRVEYGARGHWETASRGAEPYQQATAEASAGAAVALRGRMLAGQDVSAAIREITRAPMDGGRSVAAVLHHRLGIAPSYREAAGVTDPHQVIRGRPATRKTACQFSRAWA